MTDNQERAAFEKRRIPNLNLKRNRGSGYYYQVTQAAFRDFLDGWKAAIASRQRKEVGDENLIKEICGIEMKNYLGETGFISPSFARELITKIRRASSPTNQDSVDVSGYKEHLEAARRANDGSVITVWKDGTWKHWQTLDAKYAEKEPDWLVTIKLNNNHQDATRIRELELSYELFEQFVIDELGPPALAEDNMSFYEVAKRAFNAGRRAVRTQLNSEEQLGFLADDIMKMLADHVYNCQRPLRTKLCALARPYLAQALIKSLPQKEE